MIEYRASSGSLIEKINGIDYTVGSEPSIRAELTGLYSQLAGGDDVAGRISLRELRLEKLSQLQSGDE